MRKIALAVTAAAIAVSAHAIAGTQSAPATPVAVQAGDYALDKSHAKIVWSTSHFGFSTYYGEFTDFDAKLNLDPANPANSKLSVTVAMTSVDTHNDKLDAHLESADFFDVAAHPTATFTSTAVRRTGAATADVTGNFTLRGVTKPITLHVTFNKAGENMAKRYTAGFSAEGVIKRSDFGVSYAVPAVGDEVKLQISGEFNAA